MWVKKSLVFEPLADAEWNQTHAQLPTVDTAHDGFWRIYYASRDKKGRSHPSYVDVAANDPGTVMYRHNAPILPLGDPGSFDENGILPSWIVTVEGVKYLYYQGWTLNSTDPRQSSIGLALSYDGGTTFEKYGKPVLGSGRFDPFGTATVCVLVECGVWKNWYMSVISRKTVHGRAELSYHLKYAESRDGRRWRRDGTIAVDLAPDEGGLTRASVINDGDVYRMWYCYRKAVGYRTDRSASYRIGYAESQDGISWIRADHKSGIGPSTEGWDSEMIEYPHVVVSGSSRYLFYNGNGFGRSGFGYALWRNPDDVRD